MSASASASDSHSHSPSHAAVKAVDLSRPIAPHALIADLIRTCHCVQGSILLVEGIEAHVPVSWRYRTVRLLLGDGQLCVQALLRPEMHRFVSQLYVGCYVQLNSFEIRSAPLCSNGEEIDGASGEPRQMAFLIVRHLAVVGWNIAYMQLAGTTGQEEKPRKTAEKDKAVVRKDSDEPEAVNSPWRRPLSVEKEPAAPKRDGSSHIMEVSGQSASERRSGADIQQQAATRSLHDCSAVDNFP